MFHTQSLEACLEKLDTTLAGLSSEEAAKRIEHYGKNRLPEAKKRTLSLIFIEQFKNPIIYVLLMATIVSFAIKEYSDAGFILAVLFINAVIGSYQEYTAGERADALKNVVKTYVAVLRDGKRIELSSEEITVSDIVFFESGMKVPADIRLIHTHDLQVNESLLTGESVDVFKDASYLSGDIDEPIGDRQNMLYAGSMVTKGRAKGVVTAVADQTEVGKIASMLAFSESAKPPLIQRMERFSFKIAKVIGVVVLFVIVLGIYQEAPLKEIFFFAVAMAVSTIPEGLPVAITVALSIASAAMSRRNVIVRKLSSIEGLGSCTLIASDKTGTMTQNRLSVEKFVSPLKSYELRERVDEEVLLTAALCNEAVFQKREEGLGAMGDQVDIALGRYVYEIDSSYLDLKKEARLIDEIPYEPVNMFSAVAYLLGERTLHFVKGSPEVILNMSLLSGEEKRAVLEQVDEWAAKGYRNIALGYREDEEERIAKEGYTYLGFAAIIDPLREGVKEAVKTAQMAGIEVVMVTGDHPNTAYSIAKEVGIAMGRDELMDGRELSHWEDHGEDKEEIAHKRVFARVSPEQKQLIVKTFQALGHFVAVTGDGVNDAPALKYANIGISMGKSGTDVARESSDLILTDDAFSSIINGIEEGRIAYDNIRKVIHLLISTGFAEIVLILLSMLFFLPIPLLPVQLLWLNLVTNGIQDVALGLERAEPGVLRRKARDPKEPIFNMAMISRVVVGGLYMGLCAFALFYTLIDQGYSEEESRNITLLLMVLFENVHVFNSRTEKHAITKIRHSQNKFLWISVFVAQSIHIASMHIPFMQELLGVAPVTLQIWPLLLLVALLLMGVMETEKLVRARVSREKQGS